MMIARGSVLLVVSFVVVSCRPVTPPKSLEVTCAPDDVACVNAGMGDAAPGTTGGDGGAGQSASGDGSAASGSAASGGAASGGAGNGGSTVSSPAKQCGNGTLEKGETCDPETTCPTLDTCRTDNGCLAPMLTGDPTSCDVGCELAMIEMCVAGDGCCPASCNSALDADCSDSCGDGTVDPDETCEPANADAPCPAACDDQDPCTKDFQTGTPEQCNVVCTNVAILQPAEGDSCCPPGASGTNDSDCLVRCGDQKLDPGEICDGDCPESCDDGDPCTTDTMSGSVAECTAACTSTPITEPAPGDGCCPPDANAETDSDCSASCGNGAKEGSETCDGADCPTSCDDMDPCTMDVIVGSAAQCTAACTNKPITAPAGGDGCCPPNANANNDDDCEPECGNGIMEEGEKCDGASCQMDCDDGDDCTEDGTTGSPNTCDVSCKNDAITPCCGNGRTERGETCDGANCRMTCRASGQCMSARLEGRAEDCNVECVETEMTPCCGNGRVERPSETCDGNCDSLDCDDGNPCHRPTYVGSAAACTRDCGQPTTVGTNGGEENACGGCDRLTHPNPGEGFPGEPMEGSPCRPTTSNLPECATAGGLVCYGDNEFRCVNLVANNDECSLRGLDDNCNGEVIMEEASCPPP